MKPNKPLRVLALAILATFALGARCGNTTTNDQSQQPPQGTSGSTSDMGAGTAPSGGSSGNGGSQSNTP